MGVKLQHNVPNVTALNLFGAVVTPSAFLLWVRLYGPTYRSIQSPTIYLRIVCRSRAMSRRLLGGGCIIILFYIKL